MADMHRASGDVNQLAAVSWDVDGVFSAKRLSESRSDRPEHRSLQPEVDALVDLTRQIQRLQLGTSSDEAPATVPEQTSKESKADATEQRAEERNQQLAALYCQRAESILRCVDFDASARLSATLFSAMPSVQDTESDAPEQQEEGDRIDSPELHGEHSAPAPTLCGVEKALDDAVTAIALAPDCVDAFVLAAQCARALGNTVHAVEFIALARQRTGADDTARIDHLARELAVDAQTLPLDSLAPPLKTTLELLAAFDTPNQDEQQQQQQQGDESEDESEEPEDRGDSNDERERFYDTLRTGVRTLRAIAAAPWLANLETMMHENVHHQCASRDDVHALDAAFDTTAAFLGALLAHDLTVVALGLTEHVSSIQELLAAVTATVRATGARRQLLVENRSVRKWLAQTLAPAVRRFPTQIGRMSLSALEAAVANGTGTSQSHQEAVLAMLMRDALLVLTRVLLAMASWRRCTTMPHALLYAELCADLAKEIGARDGTFSGLSRFELVCNDVYARGLLELTPEHSDALQLHQESLQAALTTKDQSYALRCHHHVGQVFLRMGELELAQSEFTEMLHTSRALGESRIESLAQYELGECCVQRGNLPQAHAHFKRAQTLCNQTANAGGTWRLQSVQQAIAFYAAMKPARRGAIRIATAKPRPRRGSFVHTASLLQQVAPASDALSSSADDESLVDAPKLRRPAIWIGPPKLLPKTERDSERSLLRTLLGEQTDPLIVVDECPEARDERSPSAVAVTTTVAEKLFRTVGAAAAVAERPQTPKRGGAKPRRTGAWRDSVFAVPPSYTELRSLAAAACSP